MLYRWGLLNDPQPTDPVVATCEDAADAACDASWSELGPTGVYAVWDDVHEIVAIAYDGHMYWR